MKEYFNRPRLAPAFVALGLVLFSLASHAATCPRELQLLEGEWHEFRKGEFILQYTLKGEHALRESIDTAASGVPNVVADAATQLTAMRDMLKHLKFRLPLESPRYLEQGASHVLVRFRQMQGLNGRAFDEVRRMPSGECVLIVEVGSHYRSGNLTPAHELFHQVQNGYTPFKHPWFYEGIARWAETILGKSSVVAGPVPETENNLSAFWRQSYAAVSTWYGLIERCDNQSAKVTVPDYIRTLRYRNGRSVLLDDEVPGHVAIRRVLEAFGELSEQAIKAEGLKRHGWPESAQRDPLYAADMWNAVLRELKCYPAPDGALLRKRVETDRKSTIKLA